LDRTSFGFSTSYDGEYTIDSLIRFKQNGSYKLIVYDEDDTSIDGERTFTVGSSSSSSSSSSVDGFTSSELSTVQDIYDARPSMITDLKNNYSKLRNSTTWKNRSDTFYDDMSDILDDIDEREYQDYDDFNDAWVAWYSYTINLRD
jgi:hypothetical protein